jgi:hypothetical protein
MTPPPASAAPAASASPAITPPPQFTPDPATLNENSKHARDQADEDAKTKREIALKEAEEKAKNQYKPPKSYRPKYDGGRLLGIEDPNSGEFLTDPDKMPPEARAIYDKAQAIDKQKDDAKRLDEDRRFNRQLELQTTAFQNALKRNDYTTAQKAVKDADKNYQDAIDRQKTMDQNVADIAEAQKSGKQNQQAMMSLLANHIGMTSGAQPKMRMSKAQWDEAKDSVPLLDRIEAKFDKDGYLSGVVLTNEQVNQMVELAHQKTGVLKDHVERIKTENADALGQKNGMTPPPSRQKQGAPKKIIVTQQDIDNASK